MSKKSVKPIASALGAAVVGSLLVSTGVNAASNPFSINEVPGAQIQLASAGSASCGATKAPPKASQGNCGSANKTPAKASQGSCGSSKAATKTSEASCGASKS